MTRLAIVATAKILLRPGSLWPAILERTRQALDSGALHPIETRFDYLEQSGVRFLIRVARNLERKAQDKRRQGAEAPAASLEPNPFLAPEPALRVADISDTHLALLNKFNVIDHHLLLVTRRYHDQDCLLNRADFEALSVCMAEFNALGFYNGGRVAGASQRHKHLQIVPALGPESLRAPVEALIAPEEPAGTELALPFAHAFAPLRSFEPHELLGCYGRLLQRIGCAQPPAPYNLLLTRDWMLAVPRSREGVDGISVNALGFAGSLLFRHEAERERVRARGCLALLAACVGSAATARVP